MIFIVVRWPVKPEHADDWPAITAAYTEGTRAEPGNLWFDWSRSVDDPTTYVLVEGFEDGAGAAHVGADHFTRAMAELPAYLRATPEIVSTTLEGRSGWDVMAELEVTP